MLKKSCKGDIFKINRKATCYDLKAIIFLNSTHYDEFVRMKTKSVPPPYDRQNIIIFHQQQKILYQLNDSYEVLAQYVPICF